jgi:hypothetical protein
MTNKMFKLSDKYANLLIEVWETGIDAIVESYHTKLYYGDLLEFGTVVYYKNQLWFFSKPSNQGILHGVWTNGDGETKNTYDFLVDIINYAGRPVEIALDAGRFIPGVEKEGNK